MDFNKIATAVIGKAVKADVLKEVCKSLPDGAVFDGEMDVHISFTGKKGVSSEMNPTLSVLCLPFLAEILRRSGVQRQNIPDLVTKVAEDVFLGEKFADTILEQHKEIEDVIKEVQSKISAKLPKISKAGSVKVSCACLNVSGEVNGEVFENIELQSSKKSKKDVEAVKLKVAEAEEVE